MGNFPVPETETFKVNPTLKILISDYTPGFSVKFQGRVKLISKSISSD